MTDEQKAAYVFAQAIAAQIEMQAMLAANEDRARRGEAQAYNEAAFLALSEKYGLYHNHLMTLFHN